MDRLTAMAVLRLRRVRGAAPLAGGGGSAEAGPGDSGARDDDDAALMELALSAPEAQEVRPPLQTVRTVSVVVGAALLLVGILAGLGTVRAVLGAGGASVPPVNVMVVLSSLLLVQSAALIGWFALLVMRLPALRSTVIGRLHRAIVVRMTRRSGARSARADAGRAATAVAGSVLSRGGAARWTVAAATHGFWTGFNFGAAVMLMLLFTTRQYTFGWETTILNETAVERGAAHLGAAPRLLGFPVPGPELIAMTRTDRIGLGSAVLAEGREAWAGFIVGSLLVYGLSPRLLLLGLSLTLRRRALSACWFDGDDPDLLLARAAMRQGARTRGDADGGKQIPAATQRPDLDEEVEIVRADAAPHGDGSVPQGPPAILGFEIAEPGGGWPPRLHGQRWHDLGIVESSAQRREAVRAVHETRTPIGPLVVVAELAAIPDRGVSGFLTELARVRPGAVRMVLTGGERLRQRDGAAAVARRAEQWQACAARAGIERPSVTELDLDHLTDAARRRFAALLSGSAADMSASVTEQFGRAITRVRAFIAHEQGAPEEEGDVRVQVSPAAAAALHADLLQIFGGAAPGGAASRLLGTLISGDGDAAEGDPAQRALRALGQHPLRSLERASSRMLAQLPAVVSRESRWVMAGAAGGAMACLGAAFLAAPVAAAALPAWTVFGAATMGAVRAMRAAAQSGSGAGTAPPGDGADHDAEEAQEAGRLRRQIPAAAVHLLVLAGGAFSASRGAKVMEEVLRDLSLPRDDSAREVGAFIAEIDARWRRAVRAEAEAGEQGS